MASSAHTSEEEIKEIYDTEEVLDKKVEELAKLVLNSKHMVAYTGAGISTSAGIPDFRGPEGVWTLKAQGRKRTAPATEKGAAKPTLCHMALVHLQNTGRLKYLVSQNCDGLHIKSGINPGNISELHGNSNVEACSKCGAVYYRQVRVRPKNYKKMSKTRITGRVCSTKRCGGDLRYTTVAFNQSMPDVSLDKAETYSKKADLALTLGTSMLVEPACTLPTLGKAALVIVNLQKTKYDEECKIRIFAKIDDVICMLFKKMEQMATIKQGDKVTAQVAAAKEEKVASVLPGTIAKVNDDGTYDIHFINSKCRKQCPRSEVELFAIPRWQGLEYQTPDWVAGFAKTWPFRTAPDDDWFLGRHINRHMRSFAQTTTVPDLTLEKHNALKQLKVCVRSAKNTYRDYMQYCTEAEDTNAKFTKMQQEKVDESTMKRQQDLVGEADKMVTESRKNLVAFLSKLGDFLAENADALKGLKEFKDAQISYRFFDGKLRPAKGKKSSGSTTTTTTTTTSSTTPTP